MRVHRAGFPWHSLAVAVALSFIGCSERDQGEPLAKVQFSAQQTEALRRMNEAEVNLEVALEMLHGVGLDVDTAPDGREAVRMAMAGVYDLVLMDMQMPEMGGLEATHAIRGLGGWQTRPIVALTANAFDDDRQACAVAGMNDFITKPMEVSRLYEVLLLWLDAGASRSADVAGIGSQTHS